MSIDQQVSPKKPFTGSYLDGLTTLTLNSTTMRNILQRWLESSMPFESLEVTAVKADTYEGFKIELQKKEVITP